MRINYNVSAMLANNSLTNNDNALSTSLQRLSSGVKINRAKDNPAGLAMGNRMHAQLSGISVATQNSGNGVSVIETADGALSEVTEMLQRINELTVKASHGVLTDNDRIMIQDEVASLKKEITRIAQDTEFNGQPLLNGNFERKGYTDEPDIKVLSYSEDVVAQVYTVNSLSLIDDPITGEKILDPSNPLVLGAGFPPAADLFPPEIKDDILTIKSKFGFELKLDLTKASSGATGTTYSNINVDITGIGAMRLQIGANEGQIVEICIPDISLRNMGIEKIDVSTQQDAEKALERMPEALRFLTSARSRLGAYQNRLESTINSLDITSENMTAAYARIMDVDMAEEMTEYTTHQIMTQAGLSMLAQANERPAQVLQLLQ